jgi:hypothetical protein
VEWFFTAVLVVSALAVTGLLGFGAYRLYSSQQR